MKVQDSLSIRVTDAISLVPEKASIFYSPKSVLYLGGSRYRFASTSRTSPSAISVECIGGSGDFHFFNNDSKVVSLVPAKEGSDIPAGYCLGLIAEGLGVAKVTVSDDVLGPAGASLSQAVVLVSKAGSIELDIPYLLPVKSEVPATVRVYDERWQVFRSSPGIAL